MTARWMPGALGGLLAVGLLGAGLLSAGLPLARAAEADTADRLPAARLAPLAAARRAEVSDPTRPPAGWLRPPAASAGGGAASAARTPAAAPATPHRLLAVRIGDANLALIDDRLARVGDRVGDSAVVAIDAQGVTLRGPQGLRRLKLAPEVEKVDRPERLPVPLDRTRLADRKDSR